MPCNDFSLRMNWISKKWRERENLSTGDVRWVALNRWLVRSLFKQKWNGGLDNLLDKQQCPLFTVACVAAASLNNVNRSNQHLGTKQNITEMFRSCRPEPTTRVFDE